MQGKIGSIIESNDDVIHVAASGESSKSTDGSGPDSGQESIGPPELIDCGFEQVEPETTRFSSQPGVEGIRLTKSGKPDGRYRSGRRKTGTDSETAGNQTLSSKISLEKLLLSLHQMGAAFLSVQELELDPREAKDLADGIQEVGKYYAMNFDPKKIAILNLCVIAGGIYGTRIMAYRTRKELERGNRPQPVKVNAKVKPKETVQDRPLNEMSASEIWFEPAIGAD